MFKNWVMKLQLNLEMKNLSNMCDLMNLLLPYLAVLHRE